MTELQEKKRGRPRADEPRANVNSWVPVSHYDTLIRLSNARRMSVSKFVAVLIANVANPKPPR